MSNAKHTPTPWEFRESDDHELQVIGYAPSDYYPNPKRSDGLWPQIVMLVKPHRKGAKRGGSVTYLPFTDEEKANAELIVRAVNSYEDMLKAIKAFLNDVATMANDVRFDAVGHEFVNNNVDRFQQAIKRAEGK